MITFRLVLFLGLEQDSSDMTLRKVDSCDNATSSSSRRWLQEGLVSYYSTTIVFLACIHFSFSEISNDALMMPRPFQSPLPLQGAAEAPLGLRILSAMAFLFLWRKSIFWPVSTQVSQKDFPREKTPCRISLMLPRWRKHVHLAFLHGDTHTHFSFLVPPH